MNFNTEAINWDNEKRVKRAKLIADEIIKVLQMKDHYKALEFGCGTGLVSFNLYDKFKHITLIDTSKGMIDTLKNKIQKAKIQNMTALQIDPNTELSFEDKYDVIYTSMVLHHIKDVANTLKSLYGILKNDGHLFIVDLVEDDGSFHKLEKDFDGHNGFNPNELTGLLEKVGFQNIKANIFFEDYKIIGDTKINYSLFFIVGEK